MKVNYPIEVPEGKYCWAFPEAICGYFDNEGGHASCNLKFYEQKYTKEGFVLKSPECQKLKPI